jgi:acyl-coenzyme A thioesterase PaaI-like protein
MSLDSETLGMIGARMARDTPQSAALGIRFVSAQGGVAVLEVPYSAELVGDPGTGVLA